MSRYFVLAYKRSEGRLVESVYESEGLADAAAQRFAWEQKYRAADNDVEVALMSSPSLADLKRTHARYFKSLIELTG
jgi:hypothetical protein